MAAITVSASYQSGAILTLGRQYENNATTLKFDCSELAETYGSGSASIYALRHGEATPYLVAGVSMESDGTTVDWVVSSYDTAICGSGLCELRWAPTSDSTVSARPILFKTKVLQGVGESDVEGGTVTSWLELLQAYIEQIEAAVESAEDLVDRLGATYQLTIINVASKLGTGTEDSPISLADLEISDGNVLYFNNNTFYLDPATIEGVQDLTVLANEATLTGTTEQTEALLHFRDCDNLYFNGGLITGENVNIGLQVTASQNVHIENTKFSDISGADFESGCAIFLLGDCSGFNIESCYIDGINGGVVSSDGFIHAYGIFINRRGSDLTYSASGSINNCVITNVAGTDTDDTKADGDGIFIQVPPYLDDDSELVRPMAYIKVTDCYITDCKKRGIKLSCCGATVENCYVVGAFWYSAIDCQYGFATIDHCYISDVSDYTSTSVNNIMMSDGNNTVRNCTIGGAFYTENDDGEEELTGRPGIRCGDRLSGSVIGSDEPWGPIIIEGNTFNYVRRCFYAYSSSSDNEYTLQKFVFRDNIIAWDKAARWVEISSTVFGTIETFEMVDWLCTFGNSRSEVKETWSSFVYPVSLGCTFTEAFYLHSKNWEDEPMSGYSGLPTDVHHSKIVYSGSNMGQITWHEWHAESPSLTMGTRAPDSLTSTLSKQLLYNSKVGDVYTDSSTGDIYYCTEAGTSSSIGTWTQGGSNTGDTYTLTDEDKSEIANIVLGLVTDGDEVSY